PPAWTCSRSSSWRCSPPSSGGARGCALGPPGRRGARCEAPGRASRGRGRRRRVPLRRLPSAGVVACGVRRPGTTGRGSGAAHRLGARGPDRRRDRLYLWVRLLPAPAAVGRPVRGRLRVVGARDGGGALPRVVRRRGRAPRAPGSAGQPGGAGPPGGAGAPAGGRRGGRRGGPGRVVVSLGVDPWLVAVGRFPLGLAGLQSRRRAPAAPGLRGRRPLPRRGHRRLRFRDRAGDTGTPAPRDGRVRPGTAHRPGRGARPGGARARQGGDGGGSDVRVAVIQGNVPRLGLDFNSQRAAVLDNHLAETHRLADDVAAGAEPRPDLVLWPENASDVPALDDDAAAAALTEASVAVGAPIFLGTIDRLGGGPDTLNTQLLWRGSSGPVDRRDEEYIQPCGAWLPWRDLIEALFPIAENAGHFVPGEGDGTVDVAGVTAGTATCFEVAFDAAARDPVSGGAQILTVPTNNATFGHSPMSYQQLA